MTQLRNVLELMVRAMAGATAITAFAAFAATTSSPAPGATPQSWQVPPAQQVRIEQHFLIRVTPGTLAMPPWAVELLEQEDRAVRVEERKTDKCLNIASIAAVHPGDGDELLLMLHDDRIISATLEKRCNARNFYSGFYLDRNADGAICSGRDILHSRSGDNCKVRRLHELVAAGERRNP